MGGKVLQIALIGYMPLPPAPSGTGCRIAQSGLKLIFPTTKSDVFFQKVVKLNL